jgi:tyrosine-specific transport protein
MKRPFLPFLTVVLLITGTTVGAGMLGLPIKTGLSGLLPSLTGMVIVWGLMLAAAWVLAEGMIASGRAASDLPTLFQQSLGSPGKWLSIAGYLIIFYGLLVAYLSGAATILADLVPLPLPKTAWLMIFFAAASALVWLGLDVARKANAILMALLSISFVFLLVRVGRHLEPGHLDYTDWHFLPSALPIIVCAFSFHGIIPAVCRSLKGDPRACRRALVIGTLLALGVNALWITAVMGALPLAGPGRATILAAFENNLPATIPLSVRLNSTVITTAGTIFALAAIVTSYIGVGVALMGFCGDLISSHGKMHPRLWEGALAFGPPLGVALIYPGLFLKALDLVGGIGILLVFGILPSLMLIRSGKETKSRRRLCGYVMIFIFALLMLLELGQEAGWLQIHPNAEYWHGK